MSAATEKGDGKIECKVDGARTHSIQLHLKQNHPAYTLERYKAEYPGEPLLSDMAEKAVKNALKGKEEKAKEIRLTGGARQPLNEIFGLGDSKAALNAKGLPIPILVFGDHDEDALALVPEVDPNFVFDIELVKTVLIAFELNTPALLWGYHGTGKTTNFEQVAARTKRPFMRVQHTVNTEESHVIGQWTVKGGETVFQYGPLAIAMIQGYVYCADEYDRAIAPVLSVYQPVLEGKALFIKEAPPEMRVVRPHPNFRFVATGNTNGCGDETGLYQGTQMQDAANYSRFGVTVEVGYMDEKTETMVVAGQGQIDKKDAQKIVTFANQIRDAFKAGRMGATIGPRELINAAKFAVMRGGNWRAGLTASWMARLSRIDREVADGYAQRCFG